MHMLNTEVVLVKLYLWLPTYLCFFSNYIFKSKFSIFCYTYIKNHKCVKPPRFSRTINPHSGFKNLPPAYSERLRTQSICFFYFKLDCTQVMNWKQNYTTIIIRSGCFTLIHNIKPLVNWGKYTLLSCKSNQNIFSKASNR